jgi:hypothetical protein
MRFIEECKQGMQEKAESILLKETNQYIDYEEDDEE